MHYRNPVHGNLKHISAGDQTFAKTSIFLVKIDLDPHTLLCSWAADAGVLVIHLSTVSTVKRQGFLMLTTASPASHTLVMLGGCKMERGPARAHLLTKV